MIKQVLSMMLIGTFLFAMTGREVMDKQKKLQSSETEKTLEQMILVDSDGGKEVRAVRRFIKKDLKADLTKSLITFDKPADVRGVALLNHQITQTDEDQWIYMPALKKLQRIAQGSKKNYFMGTDFTYEDLSTDKLDNYKYKILREDSINRGKDECYVIEATPTDSYKKETYYGKKILWVKKDKFYIVQIKFFSKRMKLIKTQKAFKFKNLVSTIYRPLFVVINNIKETHKTFVKIVKIEINKGLNDKIFKQRYILNERHMSE